MPTLTVDIDGNPVTLPAASYGEFGLKVWPPEALDIVLQAFTRRRHADTKSRAWTKIEKRAKNGDHVGINGSLFCPPKTAKEPKPPGRPREGKQTGKPLCRHQHTFNWEGWARGEFRRWRSCLECRRRFESTAGGRKDG